MSCPLASIYIVAAELGRQVIASKICRNRRNPSPPAAGAAIGVLIAWLAAAPRASGAPPPGAAGPAPSGAADLLALLTEEDYESQRARLLASLPPGDGRCGFLGGLAGERNARVRENAVRLLADAGCAGLASYRPYLDDASPWVVDAVLRAIERHRIGAAVPYLLERLEDPRRILEGERVRTIGATAHRALRVVTCQSFHYDPDAPPAARAGARRRFAEWYASARSRPRDSWVREGIARAREALQRPGTAWRIEALALLALIGAPAEPELRAALRRAPGDLQAGVVCTSDEPPRVGDALDCVLLVQNAAGRRVALAAAPGAPRVRLVPLPPPGVREPGAREPGVREPGAREPGVREPAAPPRDAASGGPLEEALIDLGPGETLERRFKAGPVGAAGRYEVRATLEAPASAPGAAPPIEGRTVVRFEQ